MKIWHKFTEVAEKLKDKSTVVTIGNFDGVHRGHQKIIQRTVTLARELDCLAVVLTFANHTTTVLGSQSLLINPPVIRRNLISAQGIEALLEVAFDQRLAATTPEKFFEEYLLNLLHIKALVVGHDFRFGRAGAGDYQLLQQLETTKQLVLEQISPLTQDQFVISSSKIRQFLQQGDLAAANQMLGYRYFIIGVIQRGKQLARKMGFPTANLILDSTYLIPKYGVYLVSCNFGNKLYYGIANLGIKPTFGGRVPLLEVHLFETTLNLYDQEIQVDFLKFIRTEQLFAGMEQLQVAIENDIQIAKHYLDQGDF